MIPGGVNVDGPYFKLLKNIHEQHLAMLASVLLMFPLHQCLMKCPGAPPSVSLIYDHAHLQ